MFAPELHASSDAIEPISLRQAVKNIQSRLRGSFEERSISKPGFYIQAMFILYALLSNSAVYKS